MNERGDAAVRFTPLRATLRRHPAAQWALSIYRLHRGHFAKVAKRTELMSAWHKADIPVTLIRWHTPFSLIAATPYIPNKPKFIKPLAVFARNFVFPVTLI